MALPGLFPIYPDPILLKYQVSLAIPMPPDVTSDISKSLGITSSYPLLVPNVDMIQAFIKGDIGIADKLTKESLFLNFNHPIAQKDPKVLKSFAKNVNFNLPDVEKYKKDGKTKIPKEDVVVPPMDGIGLKGFEKTLLTSIFETQKPYLEIAKLVIGNVAKIEDIIARVMPLAGNPLVAKSLKPIGNNGGTVKMKLFKTLVEKMGCLERPVYFLGKSGDVFNMAPSREFFREHYDNLNIKFDYHVNFEVNEEEEMNDFLIRIKLELDDNTLVDMQVIVKFASSEMSGKLSAKYKFDISDNFNYLISKKQYGN